jgi:hypothetical protein
MLCTIGFTEKGHSPKPPVRYENEIFQKEIRGRQIVSKIILGYEIEPYPTIRAGKKAVSLSQSDRSATLGTLIFNFPGDRSIFFHRIDYSR